MSNRFPPFAALFLLIQGTFITQVMNADLGSARQSLLASAGIAEVHASATATPSERVIARLQRRLRAVGMDVTTEQIESALADKRRFLNSAITVNFAINTQGTVAVPEPWTIRVSEHPEWLIPVLDSEGFHYVINEKTIADNFVAYLPDTFVRPTDAVAIPDEDPTRMTVTGAPSPGWYIDQGLSTRLISDAIRQQGSYLSLSLTYDPGHLFVSAENGITKYSLLSTGKSNFDNSPFGRQANVRKALNEHLNGFVIASGATFSFNSVLGGAINTGNGWYNSLIIVNGKDLVQAPGGGICQAATTAYRAGVLAGLPIPVRANHSLYVTHYKDYGIGVDATVYPGSQDLKMQNDTGNRIIILARSIGEEAFVEMYGIPDGRSVSIDGPYFSSTAPEGALFRGRKLMKNEIGWKQSVRYADGRTISTDIVSRYLALPRTLASEYSEPRGIEELQTLAIEPADTAIVSVH